MAELTLTAMDARVANDSVDTKFTDLDQLLDVIEETSDYEVMLIQGRAY